MADLWRPDTVEEYVELDRYLAGLKRKSISDWGDAMRWYIKNDLFYLVSRCLSCAKIRHSETGKPVMNHPYYLGLSRDVEYMVSQGGGVVADSRGMGKSTVGTFGFTIQRILSHPEATGFICSEYKVAAQKHYMQIYRELSKSKLLKQLFDDVLYWDPKSESPEDLHEWSRDSLTVKRRENVKEATLTTSSFFDGGDVGGHYDYGWFDDCETGKMIRGGPERINEGKKKFSEHIRLVKPLHIKRHVVMVVNTFWHVEGLVRQHYVEVEQRDPKLVRNVPGEDINRPGDGPLGGSPNYPYTVTELHNTYKDTFDKQEYGLQVANSFIAGETRKLRADSIQYYEESAYKRMRTRYTYITVDPSRGGDSGCAVAWATGWDESVSMVGGWVKKIDFATNDFDDPFLRLVLYTKANSRRLVEVRVEEIGQSTWATRVKDLLKRHRIFTPVVACKQIHVNRQGEFHTGKHEKHFERVNPALSTGKIFLPKLKRDGGAGLPYIDEDGKPGCLAQWFIDWEVSEWPMAPEDTVLDALALMWEKPKNGISPLLFPSEPRSRDTEDDDFYSRGRREGTWMSAA